MRNGAGGGRWGILLVLMSTVAGAQAPTIAWAVEAEYRPTLAVLEVVAFDLASIERAEQLEAELLAMLAAGEQFGEVMSPTEVQARLGSEAVSGGAPLEPGPPCTERACLESVLARVQKQRVVRLAVQEHETGSRVSLVGLDPALPALVQVELDVVDRSSPSTPAQRDVTFVRKVLPQLRAALWALAVPNARLIVENPDPALTVLIDGASAGRGRVEVIRPPGDVLVSIGGTFYEPSDHALTLTPGETTTVELRLLARHVTPLVAKKTDYAGLMSRPGVYVAMSGLTLLSLGAGLGFGTLVTGARLAEPGAPVQVTRLDAMNAPAQAVVANVLIAAGVALSAGGIAWVALTPSQSSLGVDRASHGWTLSFGGKL